MGAPPHAPQGDALSAPGPALSGSPEPQVDLASLVDAACAGDPGAFDELVEATHRATYTLALRLTGNPEDARDVTQEAYLRAYRGLEGFRGEAAFTTWLYRITANCAASHLGRGSRHRHEALPAAEEVLDPRSDLDPALRADASDLRDRLLVALDSLPPKLRSVVVLRDVYEMSHDTIAAELGISTSAAKVRLHRARLKLRSEVFPELDEVGSRAL